MSDLLVARADALPGPTRVALENMACLGGQVDLGLLQAATGLDPGPLRERLAPALADGLILPEPGPVEAVRFRHDRIPESLLGHMPAQRRQAMRLELARRLADHHDLVAVAAEQYLPVVDLVSDPAETTRVVTLLRAAADQAMAQCYYAEVERLLSADWTPAPCWWCRSSTVVSRGPCWYSRTGSSGPPSPLRVSTASC